MSGAGNANGSAGAGAAGAAINMPNASPLIIGISLPQSQPDAAHLLRVAREDMFDFITTELPHSLEPRSDVTAMESKWWRTSVVGQITASLTDNNFDLVLQRLPKQMEWAIHMSIPAVICPPIPSSSHPAPSLSSSSGTANPIVDHNRVMEYTRVIQSLLLKAQSANVQVWIPVNLTEESLYEFEVLQKFCSSGTMLGLMLIMPEPPTTSATEAAATQLILLHKAIGLSLKSIMFPTRIFLTNKRGYPTLSKTHQILFAELLRRIGRTIRVLIQGPSVHTSISSSATAPAPTSGTQCLPYLQYMKHIRQRNDVASVLDTHASKLEESYLDSLQRPLQPLKDHLEYSMYETFEKDPVKYAKYQEAISLALHDGVASTLSDPSAPGEPIMISICVAGAGRGPLVGCAIKAFEDLLQASPHMQHKLSLKVYAVEKNPSAVVYLESRARHEWRDYVKVIHTDARNLTLSQLDHNPIDIVVSELLGSFGDNELSPECLDPLLTSPCCKPNTMSIPREYTTHLAPISSVRLHSEAKQLAQIPHESGLPVGLQRAMETPYVVRTHSASQTHAEQDCWTFLHPAHIPSKERVAHLEFVPNPTFGTGIGSGYGPHDRAIVGMASATPATSSGPMTIHGFVGSFTAILYANESDISQISIAPSRFSEGMFSWFPLYFPFKEPLVVPAGSSISASIWRRTQSTKVWYEWCAKVHRNGEIFNVTPIHNPNGRSSYASM